MMSKDKIKRKFKKKSSNRRSSHVSSVVPAWEPSKPEKCFTGNTQELNREVLKKVNLFDHYQPKAPESKQITEFKSAKPYKLKIVKFQTTEIIEGLGSLSLIDQSQSDSNIKVVRKSRHSLETGPRIKMIDDKDTLTNRLTLGVIFDNWAKVANFGLPAEAGDSYLVHESISEPTKPKKSIPGGDKISSCESKKRLRKRSSFNKKATVISSLVKDDYHPSYKDTVASKMRYEFRRNKKVCPYYIVQHVMKYQRPPFWNYAKLGKGFNSFLTREQLQKICDI